MHFLRVDASFTATFYSSFFTAVAINVFIKYAFKSFPYFYQLMVSSSTYNNYNRDLTILGRQRDGQNKLLQINGSKDSSWYIINRLNLIQF